MAEVTRIEGYENFVKRMHSVPELVKKGSREAMERGLPHVVSASMDRAPVWSGKLRRSVRSRITGSGATLKGIVRPSAAHGPTIVAGRAVNRKAPPVNAMVKMLQKDGVLAPRNELLHQAYLIAQSIARKGHPANPFQMKAYRASKHFVTDAFKQMTRDIVKELARK